MPADRTHLLGLALAAATLVLWSLSPFFFASTSRRIGAYATNLMRLALAAPVLAVIAAAALWLGPGRLPGAQTWAWLALSGGVGLSLGDFFLYRSLLQEGPERTSVLMTLSPALTAAIALAALGETLSAGQTLGVALVTGGVLLAAWSRLPARAGAGTSAASPAPRTAPRKPGSYLASGAWAGVWSALCQAAGTVLARQAFLAEPGLDPLAATAIRVGAGTAILWAAALPLGLPPALGRWRERPVLKRLLAGTLAGPILGMICYVTALKFTAAGIVTTITFMGPALVIPLGAWRYGTRISLRAILGTAISLIGVAFLGFL